MEKLDLIYSYLGKEAVNDYKIIDSGLDNLIVIVNDDLVFRFPRDVNSLNVYKKEVELLNYIKPFISTNIPNMKLIEFQNTYFTIHNLIKGADFDSLNAEQKLKILPSLSKDIAEFFAELHSVKNTFLPLKKYKLEDWACYRYYDYVFEFVKKYGKTTILENAIKKFVDINDNLDDEDNVITHNDLHNGNIIVNLNNQRLSGVIDWGDAIFNNYNCDFFQLNDEVLLDVVDEYEKLTKKTVNLEFIKILKQIRVFGKIGKAIFNKTDVPKEFIRKLEEME